MRVASEISAGSPIAIAAGGKIRMHNRANRPNMLRAIRREREVASVKLSALPTEQSLRSYQQHEGHHQVNSHRRKAAGERIGLRHRHDTMQNGGQEAAQQ